MSITNQYFLPTEDVNDEKAKIVALYFHSGQKVKKGDIIYSFETTKAVVDVETELEGFIQYFVSEGNELDIGSLVCEISKIKKETLNETRIILKEKQNKLKPTKKALILANKYKIEIEKIGLEGIIKEEDLIPFIPEEVQAIKVDRCLLINRDDKFIDYLVVEKSFRSLSSEEKVEKMTEKMKKLEKKINALILTTMPNMKLKRG